MADSIHDYVLERLNENKGIPRWRTVSNGSGVSIKTIEKIARRQSANPRIDTLEKLARFFRVYPVVGPTKKPNVGEPRKTGAHDG